MELINSFRVGVPIERAWAALTDVEAIAPCMPGAVLQEIEGDSYRGRVKVKVGPITAEYSGVVLFVERDEEAHRAVLRAEGRETRGQGAATATITATLDSEGESTSVRIVTDLAVTGRVAQFGRGVLADISTKLLDQFVAALESDVLVEQQSGVRPASPEARQAMSTGPGLGTHDTERSSPRSSEPSGQPIELLDLVGAALARRMALVIAVLGLLLVVRRRFSER